MRDTDRAGVTVLELLVCLVILGAVAALLVWPSIRFDDRLRVEAEAGRLLEAYREARRWALVGNTTAELVVTADSLTIRAQFDGLPIMVWQEPGPVRSGVSLMPPTHVTAFTSRGLAGGVGNVAHVLTRGAARRQVVVSRLGRVRVMP
ncbi:MAG: type II secretion system protein [Gemmatimonadota bacterium]